VNTKEQKGRIRQIIFIFFIILFACTLINPGFIQGESTTDKTSKPPKVIIRVRSKGDFLGTVIRVNMVSKTITVRNKGIIVTFDVVNPVFKGYSNLEQIQVGDKIAISYTGDGARIIKTTGTHSIFQQETTKPTYESERKRHGSTATNKGRPVRVKERTNSKYFSDVDNNNDGRITPVELSSVIPNLTVEDFKRYDRNGDGCLNESEYNAINKSVTRGNNR
jgi:hypothetical protein